MVIISMKDACEAGAPPDTVLRWAESGKLHLIDTESGLSLICLNSLVGALGDGENGGPEKGKMS